MAMINLRILAANLLSEENNFLCQDMKSRNQNSFQKRPKIVWWVEKIYVEEENPLFHLFPLQGLSHKLSINTRHNSVRISAKWKRNTDFLVFQHANFKRRSRLKSRQIRIVLSFADWNISYQREGFCLKIMYRKF